MSDCHTSKIVKARKAHQCEEGSCRRTREIKPGDRYARHSGIFDGMPYGYAFCLRCHRAHGRVFSRKVTQAYASSNELPSVGGLLDWLLEARAW